MVPDNRGCDRRYDRRDCSGLPVNRTGACRAENHRSVLTEKGTPNVQHDFQKLNTAGFTCGKCRLWVSQAQWASAVVLDDCPGSDRFNEPMPIQPATCEHCQHYRSWSEGALGNCQRFPPTMTGGLLETTAQFPIVHSDWSCGEFSPGFDVARDMAG